MGPSTTTVLVVDPYKEDREYWVHRLHVSSPEYRVLEADTGRAGLAVCESQRVDCVVTELVLPDMSGFEVLVNLVPQASCPTIAVIVLTRLIMYPLIGIAERNGAQAYLIKSRSSGDDLDRAIYKALSHLGTTT
ncbi:MAG TPA: response regulator [Nitrospira sp.]|nr:response regulator [Nitrospira sp.]